MSSLEKYFPNPKVWLVFLILIGGVAYWLGAHTHNTEQAAPLVSNTVAEAASTTPAQTPNLSAPPSLPQPSLYLNRVPKSCQDTDTADATQCIEDYATSTTAQANTLAQRLVLAAPERAKQASSTPDFPIYFSYGGTDFLADLPIGVQKAQQVKGSYIDTLCKLDSMNLYWACVYYNEQQYLGVLKSLEGGLTSTGP